MPVPLYIQLNQEAASLDTYARQIREDVVGWPMPTLMAGGIANFPFYTISDLFFTIQDRIQTAREVIGIIRERHQIEQDLPIYKPKKDDACSICLEGPPKDPLSFQAVCNHAFHHECIETYFHGSRGIASCPVCRIALEAVDFETHVVRNEATETQWIVVHEQLEKGFAKLNACQEWFERLRLAMSNILIEIEVTLIDIETVEAFVDASIEDSVAIYHLWVRETALEIKKYRDLRTSTDSTDKANLPAAMSQFSIIGRRQ